MFPQQYYDWELTPPIGEHSEFFVSFALTRTLVLAVELLTDEGQSRSLRPSPGREHFWTLQMYAPNFKKLRATFEGNAPAIAQLVWVRKPVEKEPLYFAVPQRWARKAEDGPELLAEPGAQLPSGGLCTVLIPGKSIDPDEVDERLKELSPPVKTLYAYRRQAIDWHARAQEFFLRMDMETEPELVPERWTQTIQHVGSRLEERIWARACFGNRTPKQRPVFQPIPPEGFLSKRKREELREVSLYLVNLITSSLENHGGAELVAWAFEMFATDRLAVHHVNLEAHQHLKGHGAANGLLFLQFAEVGFYCYENDIDAEFWERHLPALVRAVHAFLETGLDARTAPGSNPTPQHFEFREGRYHRRDRLEALRGESRSAVTLSHGSPVAFLQERFTSLAAQAYPGTIGAPIGVEGVDIRSGHEAELKPCGCP